MIAFVGGTVVTLGESNRVLPGATVLVENDTVLSVKEKGEPLPDEKVREIDASGLVILPGFINAHACVAKSISPERGLEEEPALEGLSKKQARELVFYGGLAGIIEQISLGVTTIFDYHVPDSAARSNLATLADAFTLAGVRGCLCAAVSDPQNGGSVPGAFKESENFLKWCMRERLSNLKGMVGIHRSLTCSDEVLEMAADLATRMGVGVHMEMAPEPSDIQDCLSRYDMRVAQRMHDFGIVGTETIAASCAQTNEDEIDILRNSETLVAHTPSMDLVRGRQMAPILIMMRRGIRVGTGTGPYPTSPLAEARLSRLLQNHLISQPGEGSPESFVRMVFSENARLAGSVFGFRLGEIAEGAVADLVAFRAPLAEGITEERWATTLLFSLPALARAEHVMVGGNLILRDGKLQTLEEAEILVKAAEMAGVYRQTENP